MGRAPSGVITVAGHTAWARWIANLEARAHPNIVVVALANKRARTAWVVLQRDVSYDGRLLMRA